jgi:hypothetical protein
MCEVASTDLGDTVGAVIKILSVDYYKNKKESGVTSTN